MSGSKWFEMGEFRCPCCKSLGMGIDSRLIEILDYMRDELGAPLIISSGYRCEEHNHQCGGAKNSQHLYGRAADIWTPREDVTIDALYWLALAASGGGATVGIGRYYEQGFLHIDTRGYKARW